MILNEHAVDYRDEMQQQLETLRRERIVGGVEGTSPAASSSSGATAWREDDVVLLKAAARGGR